MRTSAQALILLNLVAASSLTGCVTLPRAPFTARDEARASVNGFDHIRYTQEDPALIEMLHETLKPNAQNVVSTLAISGGGANGAYGAGLLTGWTKTGERPEFQLVTGVSTGALTAPFAFLGPRWDEQLRQAYLGPSLDHLLIHRGLFGLLTPGLFSKAPLERLVRGYVTDDLLAAIAAEQVKGRRLLVGTANLDTEQLIVWDMGAIAMRGDAQARTLFADVLIASASTPGVFAPSMINVESQDQHFSEMQVDGQTYSAFFAIPQILLQAKTPASPSYKPRVFIIVNGQLESHFTVTPRSTFPILGRSLDVANKASIKAAVLSTLEFCERSACDLDVSTLPPSETDDSLDFEPSHLRSLFAAGESAIESGRAWNQVQFKANRPTPGS